MNEHGRDSAARRRANADLLTMLGALWDANPDQRFGQLVMNLSRTEGGFADTWQWSNAEWVARMTEAWNGWAAPRRDSGATREWPESRT